MSRRGLMTGIVPFLCLLCLVSLSSSASRSYAAGEQENECVILLHGLMRTDWSMGRLASFLDDQGYAVTNLHYPSTGEPVNRVAELNVSDAVKKCEALGCTKIHFVTHSLGGIVARQYLQNHAVPRGSRMVMLAPPNGGSEIADYLEGCSLYEWITGPAGQELGTGEESLPNSLKPLPVEIGIIAGNFSFNPLFSLLIPGDDDGTVAVERTKLSEMKDFIVLPCSHFYIMRDEDVMAQAAHFLENGYFKR